MSEMPDRVVVLGASGFLGRAVHAALTQAGVDVIGHSSRTLDLTHPEALAELDSVLTPGTAVVLASALTPDRGQTPATFLANTASTRRSA